MCSRACLGRSAADLDRALPNKKDMVPIYAQTTCCMISECIRLGGRRVSVYMEDACTLSTFLSLRCLALQG